MRNPSSFNTDEQAHPNLPTPAIRGALDEQFSRIGRAVGNATRWLLLSLLAQSERSVDELVELTDIQVASVSAHLKVLREAHLVTNRREGRRIIYSVTHDDVIHLCATIRHLALQALPEVREIVSAYYSAPDTWVETDVEAVIASAKRGEVTIIDLRPIEEYQAGHLPHAVSMPFQHLEETALDTLDPHTKIVAYCRGPYCAMGVRGVSWLRDHGYQATRLPFHMADLRIQNLPIIQEATTDP